MSNLKQNAVSELKFKRRDGRAFQFHPTYLTYNIYFEGLICVELLPFRQYVRSEFICSKPLVEIILQCHNYDGDNNMLESKSTANVSPSLSFNAANGSTFTFNFQHDGQVMIIGFQDGKAVSGPLNTEQVTELRDVLSAYLEKRK